MSQRIIPLAVDDEHVKGSGVNVGAAGSHDAVVLELRFSQLWRGLTKRITWLDALAEASAVTLLTAVQAVDEDTYRVTVPATPLAYAGRMSMTISGVYVNAETGKETVKAVTEAAFFRVMDSYLNAATQSDIDPTLADQLQAEIDALLDVILDARAAAKDAEAWAVGQIEGADVGSDDARHHNNAKWYAQAARDYAGTASGAATDAQEAADKASEYADDAEESKNSAAGAAEAAGLSAAAASQSEHNASEHESAALVYMQTAGDSERSAANDRQRAEVAAEQAIAAAHQVSEDTAFVAERAEIIAESARSSTKAATDAEHWADIAMAQADRVSVPPVEGVYNFIITDRITNERYAVLAMNGRLALLGVAGDTEATEMTLIDTDTGISYRLIAENGKICLQEV